MGLVCKGKIEQHLELRTQDMLAGPKGPKGGWSKRPIAKVSGSKRPTRKSKRPMRRSKRPPRESKRPRRKSKRPR